jgi:hypothetical protein
MKLTIFDRKKYLETIKKLEKRNAPNYILEAYEEGYTKVVNEYYKIKLDRIKAKNFKYSLMESKTYSDLAKTVKFSFIEAALKKSDIDFLKAFFQMTNLDIVSGKKIPPNAGRLIDQSSIRDLGLKDLYKKLR